MNSVAMSKEKIVSQFRKKDSLGLGLIRIEDLQCILKALMGLPGEKVVELITLSGAGLVRYDQFVEWLFQRCSLAKEPAMDESPEVSALKARVAELEAENAKVSSGAGTISRASTAEWEEGRALSPQMRYDEAVKRLGGDEAIRACRFQSNQIRSLVQKQGGEDKQDSVYLGLDLSMLMRDASLIQEKFAETCENLGQILQGAGLQNTVHIAPRKGLVRSTTKVNVNYGGDVRQLCDIVRGTIQIKAHGKDAVSNTYKAMLQMLRSPPAGVEFLKFKDCFLHPMKGGYRDFKFLLSLRGIICEVQISYDIIMQVKSGDGHEEYEGRRLSNDLMMDAALKDDANSVMENLRRGADPNYETKRSFAALTYAALHGNVAMAKALIDAKASPFAIDCNGCLAIRRALAFGKFPVAREILSAMAKEVDCTSRPIVVSLAARKDLISNWVMLKDSLEGTYDEEMLNLNEHVTRIMDRIFGGYDAALGLAAEAGLAKACERLLQAGAPPNALYWGSDIKVDRCPVDFAIQSGSVDTVKTLKSAGGRANIYKYSNTRVDLPNAKFREELAVGEVAKKRLAQQMQTYQNLRNKFCLTALKYDMAPQIDALIEAVHDEPGAVDLPDLLIAASESGAAGIASVVLRRDTSAECLNPKQVLELVLRGVRNDDLELATHLLSQRATFKECASAVHVAAEAGRASWITLLAEGSCPLEEPDENGELPIHVAARAGHTDVIRVLQDLGCSVNAANAVGLTPAHLAAEKSHTQMLCDLRDLGCDLASVRQTKFSRWYLLHIAVAANQAEAIRLLLALQCDANCQDTKGGTPLHHAALACRLDAVRALVDGSADVNSKYPDDHSEVNRRGCTALHLAAEEHHASAVQLLLRLRADPTVQNTAGQTVVNRNN